MPHVCCDVAKEKVVGWYHTGPRLRQSDLDITELMARYCDNPLLVICEVQVRYQPIKSLPRSPLRPPLSSSYMLEHPLFTQESTL